MPLYYDGERYWLFLPSELAINDHEVMELEKELDKILTEGMVKVDKIDKNSDEHKSDENIVIEI